MSVGERIKSRRKELGLSAEQVAEKLGVSPATIYRYESNYINNMGVDKLKPIAAVLKVSEGFLMGWEEKEGEILSENEKLIIEAYREADTITRDMVRRCLGLFTPEETERDVDRIVEEYLKNDSAPEILAK